MPAVRVAEDRAGAERLRGGIRRIIETRFGGRADVRALRGRAGILSDVKPLHRTPIPCINPRM